MLKMDSCKSNNCCQKQLLIVVLRIFFLVLYRLSWRTKQRLYLLTCDDGLSDGALHFSQRETDLKYFETRKRWVIAVKERSVTDNVTQLFFTI